MVCTAGRRASLLSGPAPHNAPSPTAGNREVRRGGPGPCASQYAVLCLCCALPLQPGPALRPTLTDLLQVGGRRLIVAIVIPAAPANEGQGRLGWQHSAGGQARLACKGALHVCSECGRAGATHTNQQSHGRLSAIALAAAMSSKSMSSKSSHVCTIPSNVGLWRPMPPHP